MHFFKRIMERFNYELERFTFKPFIMVRNVDGEEVKVYINNLFAKHWYQNQHAWPEMKWLKENILTTDDVVFDCGANSGYTSVFFSKVIGTKGTVYAFEPHPLNLEAIYKNIELNNVGNISVVNAAVGSSKGELFLSRHPNGCVTATDKDTFKVEVVKLDDFLPQALPTFIKIDVEGFELEVLRGAKNILKTKPKLDIEIHCAFFSEREQTIRDIFSMIDFDSYKLWIQLTPGGKIESFVKENYPIETIGRHDVVHLFGVAKQVTK